MIQRTIVGFPQRLDFVRQACLFAQGQVDRCRAHGFDEQAPARDSGVAQLTTVQDFVPACTTGTDKPHGSAFRDIESRGIEIDINDFCGAPVDDKGMLVACACVKLFGQPDLLLDSGHEGYQGLVG